MIKRISVILIVALVVVLAVTLYRDDSPEGVIKIGFVGPLSGSSAFLGEGGRDAMVMALEESNDTKYTYELFFEDDGRIPKISASAAAKLVSLDKVDALISATSGTGNVVSDIARANNVLHVGIASDNNVAKGDLNFLHWTPSGEVVRAFVEELTRRGIRKLGVIELNQDGVLAIMNDLERQIEGTDIRIVERERFNADDTEFKTLIGNVKNADPEIFMIMAFSPELEIIARQAKGLGFDIPFTSITSFELSQEPELFNGYWYANSAGPTDEFNKRFKSRWDRDPSVGAGNSYDALALIIEAFERAGDNSGSINPTASEAASELSMITGFSGILGLLDIGTDGIIFSPASIREVRNGKFVTIR